MKLLILAMLIGVVMSLFSALSSMSRGPQGAARTVRALTWRISLSVALFALLFLGQHLGWIEPGAMH